LLGVRGLGANSNFFDVGGHSMLATRLLSQVKERWNCALPMAIFFQSPTVRQLAAHLRLEQSEEEPFKSLVALRTEGEKPPLFVVSPGGVLFLHALAECLNRPFYGLQARGIEEGQTPLETVEEMAARYLREVRDVQPGGPYYLAGRCFGGVVAFEMAQQLRAVGEEVATLIIFDSGPPLSDALPTRQKRPRQTRTVRELALPSAAQMRFLFSRDKLQHWLESRKDFKTEPAHFRTLRDANRRANKAYLATVYDGDVTLIRSLEFVANTRKHWHLYWAQLTSRTCHMIVVSGTHRSIFEKPNVRLLAQEVEKCLERARQNQVSTTDHTTDDEKENRDIAHTFRAPCDVAD